MIQRCLNFPDKFITFRIRIRLDFLFHKRKLCPIEGSRVIIITNDILTIFPYHYLCRALPGKDEIYKWKLDESWPHANTERSKPNRFRRNRPSEQTNCHGPLCMVNSKLMLNYRKLMSSRRKKSFLVSDR